MYIKSIFSVFGIWGQKIITWTLNLCRDAIAILLLGLGIVSFLSCISYSPDDSSFLQATGTPSNNLLGLYGSTYADFILQNTVRYCHCIGHKNLQFLMIKYSYMYAV